MESEANEAFENIKLRFSATSVLLNPDFSKMFTIQSDSSTNYAVGAVLTQGEGEDEHVISYSSRTLNKSEIKYYTCTEKECLAIYMLF